MQWNPKDRKERPQASKIRKGGNLEWEMVSSFTSLALTFRVWLYFLSLWCSLYTFCLMARVVFYCLLCHVNCVVQFHYFTWLLLLHGFVILGCFTMFYRYFFRILLCHGFVLLGRFTMCFFCCAFSVFCSVYHTLLHYNHLFSLDKLKFSSFFGLISAILSQNSNWGVANCSVPTLATFIWWLIHQSDFQSFTPHFSAIFCGGCKAVVVCWVFQFYCRCSSCFLGYWRRTLVFQLFATTCSDFLSSLLFACQLHRRWEKYNAKGWTDKGAHKYGRLSDQSWWEKWGEQYDGQGSVVKWYVNKMKNFLSMISIEEYLHWWSIVLLL